MTRHRHRHRLLLAGILILAATLRLIGLGWGSRHRALGDESDFVDNVAQMLVHHDLDHRFYEYPGFFLYLLAPGQWLTGAPYNTFPAYLAGRLLVVGFGVASVGLVYLLGLRLRDQRTGLVAALLLAVSPVDVDTAHMIRTDVPLETFLLLGLLALLLDVVEQTREDNGVSPLG